MEFLKYIIGAVALGITESLPISGTGHTLLMEHIFGQGENFRMVLSFLYIGVLIAVIIAYHKEIWSLITAFFPDKTTLPAEKIKIRTVSKRTAAKSHVPVITAVRKAKTC